MHIVLFANGEKPVSETALAVLKTADICIACDCLPDERTPDFIIGDLDTLKEIPPEIKFLKISEQETNDLTKAFNFAMEKFSPDELTFIAITGLREDHTMANLSLYVDFQLKFPNCKMKIITNTGEFLLAWQDSEFELKLESPISFIAVNPLTVLTVRGVQYPVENLNLSHWWTATLNTVKKSPIQIFTQNPILIFIANK